MLITSTNGTSATAALKREGNIFKQAPMSKPWKTIKRKEKKRNTGEWKKEGEKKAEKKRNNKDKEEEKKKWERLTSSLDVFGVKNNNDNKGREGRKW